MPRIARDVTWLIGRTPLLELQRFGAGLGARIVAKLELENPGASNKDRAVLGMIEHAERHGFLTPATTIVECSAGDTALSLATVCAARGYRLVLTMPRGVAPGRANLLRALGAELVLTDAERGIRGALQRAEELARQIQPSLILQPFTNRANARIHQDTTAREVWEDCEGRVDTVVVPVGSGGTAAGCAAFFREVAPRVAVVGVEPARSAVLSGGQPGQHDIPGLGAGFVPDILTPTDLAEIVAVEDAEAFRAARELARLEGVLAGPASGAALAAARRLAARDSAAGTTIVVVLPDRGERYEEHACYATGGEQP
ncbi:MAG: cysteine synthase family protein [Planctomycetes bacterium]|nr:cysteine synthase family protein [Planctomycetota bacterium]